MGVDVAVIVVLLDTCNEVRVHIKDLPKVRPLLPKRFWSIGMLDSKNTVLVQRRK